MVKDVNSTAEFNDDLQIGVSFIDFTLLLHMHIWPLSLQTFFFFNRLSVVTVFVEILGHIFYVVKSTSFNLVQSSEYSG